MRAKERLLKQDMQGLDSSKPALSDAAFGILKMAINK